MKSVSFLALILGLAISPAFAAESRTLTGSVTNTTHDVTAPMTLELVLGDDDKVSGWITISAPLQAGRWPVTGIRKGAWCEVSYQPTPDTQTQFRGALSTEEFRGTYVFGGKGELVQYGRFQAKVR
jgi:hypothetical protein